MPPVTTLRCGLALIAIALLGPPTIPSLGAQASGTTQAGQGRGALERRLRELDDLATRSHSAQSEADLATEFVAMHRARLPVLASAGSLEGESHVESAWRHLAAALTRDPTNPTARTLATRLLVARGERIPRENESSALASMLARFPDDPDLLLVAGREARMRGDSARAVRDLLRAAAAGGSARGDIQLDLARAAQQSGDTALARRAYFAGSRDPSPAARLAYRMDLAWILPEDSMRTVDAVPNAEFTHWLEIFWNGRDAAAMAPPGTRLLEHLRRWNVVHREFLVDLPWRHTQFARVEFLFEGLDPCTRSYPAIYELLSRQTPVHPEDIRDKEPILDHRGLIYLRHGEPIRRVAGRGHGFPDLLNTLSKSSKFETPRVTAMRELAYEMDVSMAVNEGWLYWFDGKYRVLNFRGSKALGFGAATTLTGYLPVENASGKYLDDWKLRSALTAEYAQAYAALSSASSEPAPCRPAVMAVVAESRATAERSLQTDSDSPPVVTPWGAIIQVSGVGTGPDGNGVALVSYAIPLAGLDRRTTEAGVSRWDARFRVAAFEPATGRRIELDTSVHASSRSAAGAGDFLTGLLQVKLEAGSWQVAVLGMDSLGSNRAYVVDPMVPVATEGGLAISDLLLGRASGTPRWMGRAEPVPINPLGTWPYGAPVEVFAEVYGIPTGVPYRVEFSAQSIDAGKRRSIRVGSRETSGGTRIEVRRSLDVSRLQAGRYRLTVRVEAGKLVAEATREIVVLAPRARRRDGWDSPAGDVSAP